MGVGKVNTFECRARTESVLLQELWLSGLAKQGRGTVRVVGTSMAPLIDVGDKIVIQVVKDPGAIRRGDIVLLKFANTLVVHRIIGKFNENGRVYLRQKGDAGLMSDVISADHIVGKVVQISKPEKQYLLGDRRWRVSNVLLWPVLCVFDFVYRQGRRIKRKLFSYQAQRSPNRIFNLAKSVLSTAQSFALRLYLLFHGVGNGQRIGD